MLRNAWLIALLPGLSFFAILFFGKRLPLKGAELGIATVGASFFMSVVAVVQWIDRVEGATGTSEGLRAFGKSFVLRENASRIVEPVVRNVTWWQSGGLKLGAGIQIDGLAVLMMFVVTLVALLVHIYSLEYMHGDRRFTYYYAALSLFTASMLLLVIADNTLQLLVGWEFVGLCSYMLIGHWWEEGVNSAAAMKAFLTTRIGDVGLMIGVVMTFFMVQQATGKGSFSIDAINRAALSGKLNHALLLGTASMLLLGIVGKSGQFPLHTWLPDAMAGPTPISALIHAATMVVAGVYLGARLYPVFFEGFSIDDGGVNLMALTGGITILVGAGLAFVQSDIKKVLAYSTISQLGYMVMGLGVGAWIAAVFHLFVHAFLKALLFLGAGSVSHSGAHHSFDMQRSMGGLRKYMPQTFWTFIIGSAALAGIFPFAGFWSKDEILATADVNDFRFFMIIGLIGAFLTAAYMTRCVYLTFFGNFRGQGEPHESNAIITTPLWILAGFSVLAGFLNATAFNIEKFKEWFEPGIGPFFITGEQPEFSFVKAVIALGVAVSGVGIAYLYYWKDIGLRRLTERSGIARLGYKILLQKYYIDWLYTDVIVNGLKGAVARATYWIDQNVIDRVVNTAGSATASAARFTYNVVDQKVVDDAYNGLARGADETGAALQTVQSGKLQRYALMLFASVGLIALVLVLKG